MSQPQITNVSTVRRGFTIIELLIVIVIIGILAAITIVAYNGIQQRGRDARRLSDMSQIKKALEAYKTINNVYPGPPGTYGENNDPCGGWDISRTDQNSNGNAFIDPLFTSGLIGKVPTDPNDASGSGCGNYKYYLYGAGSYGCDASRGDFYVLGVADMETSAGAYPSNPGFSCSGRNWTGEFEWVTGGYTNG